ncbi:MAG: D-galactosamine 6-phosphate deaminase/isomerase [Bacteroidales bacterium]|jgi:tagatose-6-phosphate ketose/aldose isomerase|nr:D-galactosamine 6-phosphate deaminase/isomerase [Bacteroidales bacterium]MDN5328732.1 D-galactosamine 6-phosphate deaminase/isomerase [Bacteroidales bacterium]NLH51440.1 SIS domain-containing protein [Bacteroidales bacterium]NPV36372.1 SIS domain-containing protein [Bacteroidales bacterium]
MQHLGYDEKWLREKGAHHTAREISGQPTLWHHTFHLIESQIELLKKFLDSVLPETRRIILTGAGTSGYIGYSLYPVFRRKFGKHVLVIPTTELVTHPANYFFPDDNLLLVSFARSGNSPESTAAVQLAERLSGYVSHLVITCDAEGQLACYSSPFPKFNLVLPPDSNDQSLAMTGSYTSMLLAGYLIAHINELQGLSSSVKQAGDYASHLLSNYSAVVQQLASFQFSRVVFLGSGPLLGSAMESHLKVQELTDGQIVCKFDSFLGFRHGPKAVIDEQTLVFFLLSNDPYVHQYERDLILSIYKGKPPLATIGVFENSFAGLTFDYAIQLNKEHTSLLPEDMLPLVAVIPAQMLGFYKSLDLGLNPDNPSVNGAISRVVENVHIYPYVL